MLLTINFQVLLKNMWLLRELQMDLNETVLCKGLGPGHTTLEKFESEALFLRLGIPPTLIRHANPSR